MKRQTRVVIDNVAESIDDMGWPRTDNGLMKSADLKAVAKAIESIAAFWEKHPDRWVSGKEIAYPDEIATDAVDAWGGTIYENIGVPSFCNIGMIRRVPGKETEYEVKDFKAPNKKVIDFLDVNAKWVIDLNDATPLDGNIAGLRMSANVFRLAATMKDRSDESWTQAVNKAFAVNSHLLQVQNARQHKKDRARRGR